MATYRGQLPKDDPLVTYFASLHGGDAERGREIFTGHSTGQCIRCHKVNGKGGTAGPELSKTLKEKPEKNRRYLLESLITPDAKITPGFGTLALVLLDGRIVTGTLKGETETEILLETADKQILKIDPADVDERTQPRSPMPTMRKALTPRELRDVIAYLATLQ